MKRNDLLIYPSLIIFFSLLIFSSCATTGGHSSASSSLTPMELKNRISISEITLLTPDDIKAQSYLGLSGGGRFTIPQIKAEVILINVFSTTCPHCKKEAPNTNKLFQAIEEREDLKGRIKIIGIGTRNTLEDVAEFKKEYNVPFPLFPDKDMSIFEKLETRGTPTMIGIKILADGSYSVLFFRAGSIGDVSWFIGFLIEMARLDK